MNSLLRILGETGGPPELRTLVRDVLTQLFGHDLGFGIYVSKHRALYHAIADMSNESPVIASILSCVNSYYRGVADDIDLAGFATVATEIAGAHTKSEIYVKLVQALSPPSSPTSSFTLISGRKRLRNLTFPDKVIAAASLVVLLSVYFMPKRSMGTLQVPIPRTRQIAGQVDMLTPFWTTDQIMSVIPEAAEPETLSYTEALKESYEHGNKVLHKNERFEVRVGRMSTNSRTDANFLTDVVNFTNFALDIVDPAYMWSSVDHLVIHLSNTRGGDGAGAYYPQSGDIWIKNDREQSSLAIIRSLVHEIAHRVHLHAPDVALESAGHGLRKYEAFSYQSDRTDASIFDAYERVREAEAVLYLGIDSPMNADEARIYLKAHLDTTIKQLYDDAQNNSAYDKYKDKYAMTNYEEFWAEATVAYVFRHYYESNGMNVSQQFPSLDKIKAVHPALYEELQKVYSGFDPTQALTALDANNHIEWEPNLDDMRNARFPTQAHIAKFVKRNAR